MKKLSWTLILLIIIASNSYAQTNLSFTDSSLEVVGKKQSRINMLAIKKVIEDYKISIDKADTTLAKDFWLTTNQASYIHPKGHEKGWDAIKNNFYGMFARGFSKRELKSNNETIQLYDDMAVVEFYWTFNAITKGAKPISIHTMGRETQV